MLQDGGEQARLAGSSCRADGREDPAACRVQLLVARPAGTERELVDAVAAERRVRVAVDEPRHGAQATALHLHDLAAECGKVAHPPHGLDRVAGAEDEGLLDHLGIAERRSPQRRSTACRRRELREIAEEQTRRGRRHASIGTGWLEAPPAEPPPAPGRKTCPPSAAMGIRSPPSSAAASASG